MHMHVLVRVDMREAKSARRKAGELALDLAFQCRRAAASIR